MPHYALCFATNAAACLHARRIAIRPGDGPQAHVPEASGTVQTNSLLQGIPEGIFEKVPRCICVPSPGRRAALLRGRGKTVGRSAHAPGKPTSRGYGTYANLPWCREESREVFKIRTPK